MLRNVKLAEGRLPQPKCPVTNSVPIIAAAIISQGKSQTISSTKYINPNKVIAINIPNIAPIRPKTFVKNDSLHIIITFFLLQYCAAYESHQDEHNT